MHGGPGSNQGRERFAALMARSDPQVDLAEAALLVAKEEYPSLGIDRYLRNLDDLARGVAAKLGASSSGRDRIETLNNYLFEENGFAGNEEDYYDPRNSYLNEVIDRRKGIPITLSLVYTEIGRRVGLPVFGVAFPGHFLVKYIGGGEEILVDTFHGRVIGIDECKERLRAAYGDSAQFDPRLLRPASPKEIIARMLRNLKHIFLQREDWDRALLWCDRILIVAPDSPADLRDRGILYQRLDCFSAALADFERYLRLAPEDEHADAVRERIPVLLNAIAHIN